MVGSALEIRGKYGTKQVLHAAVTSACYLSRQRALVWGLSWLGRQHGVTSVSSLRRTRSGGRSGPTQHAPWTSDSGAGLVSRAGRATDAGAQSEGWGIHHRPLAEQERGRTDTW